MALIDAPLSFRIFSVAGALIAVLGSLLSALYYRGKKGQPYSPLNHFISELGEVGVSKLAWVFNTSLILTGLCLVPAAASLGCLLNSVLSKIAMAAGIVCAISLSLVGVFPMNKLKPHGYAAMTYFRAGLAMVFLFSLAIALQPKPELALPRGFALAGLPPILAFSTFLLLVSCTTQQAEDPLSIEGVERPRVWRLAVVEWLIFVTILLWFVLITIGLAA